MSILIGFLYVIEVVVCLLLALVVMLQKPKEGGLGGLAGGMGEAVFGADAGNVLIKVTIWLGAIFLVNTLALARLSSTPAKSVMSGESAPVPAKQAPEMPQLPAQVPAPAVPEAPKATPPAPAKPEVPKATPPAPAKPEAPKATPPAPAKPEVPKATPPAPAKPEAPKATPPAPAKK